MHALDWRRRPWTVSTTCAMWCRGTAPRSGLVGVLARQSGIAASRSCLRSRVHTFVCHGLSHAPRETSPRLRRWKQVRCVWLHVPLLRRLHVRVPGPPGEQVIRHTVAGEVREARRPSIVQTDPTKAVRVRHRAVAPHGPGVGDTERGLVQVDVHHRRPQTSAGRSPIRGSGTGAGRRPPRRGHEGTRLGGVPWPDDRLRPPLLLPGPPVRPLSPTPSADRCRQPLSPPAPHRPAPLPDRCAGPRPEAAAASGSVRPVVPPRARLAGTP